MLRRSGRKKRLSSSPEFEDVELNEEDVDGKPLPVYTGEETEIPLNNSNAKTLKKLKKDARKNEERKGCKPFAGCGKGIKEGTKRWKTRVKGLRKVKDKKKVRKAFMKVFRPDNA
ncbi:hypothetical protein H072_1846 [Dactylellina haptotyla CBS 200.50]|uniref:Uncharacterized protein n=1 Tax=Dactylellina haptotyla (strain CBS 200.50) TaxID=1284197 RepID=S8BX95_DACHA|nr:hypothetical protein H072_1846 [Dactylellina haptotyla CBS 200.50]